MFVLIHMYTCLKHEIFKEFLFSGQTTAPAVNHNGKPKRVSFIPPYLLALEDGGILIQSLKNGISRICFAHGHFKML